jgi:hypothetical protein
MSNTFRKTYRPLTAVEAGLVADIKTMAEKLDALYQSAGTLLNMPDYRALSIAQTKLEESVMWAVKGIT